MRLLAAAVLMATGPITTCAASETNIAHKESLVTVERSDEVPDTCPVTKPFEPSFRPPAPYPSGGAFWIGSEGLWTNIPANGTWTDLPHYTPGDSRFRQKLFWWHVGYDWRAKNPPELMVTGERLDALAPPIETDEHANAGWTNDENHPFMVVGIFIPTVGCWKITGTYKGQELSYVVWVSQKSDSHQSSECNSNELLALIKPGDPVYGDAMDLARTLQGHGFFVRYVLQSKMVRIFESQKGAALFRTNHGDFEALFLPKPQTFALVEFVESRENGRFLYSFRGSPGPTSPQPINGAYPLFFGKHANQLFITRESQLAASIVRAVD